MRATRSSAAWSTTCTSTSGDAETSALTATSWALSGRTREQERRPALRPDPRVGTRGEPPGVRPLRVHSLAFPLHAAELDATIEERGPFDLLDRYVDLAIADARFTTAPEVAAFLGVSERMVDRVLQFLHGIGHVQANGGSLALTPRGFRAVRDDRRYVEKREKLRIFFDGVRCGPLRTAHYAPGVRILDRDAAHAQRTFRLLQHGGPFQPGAVDDLARRPDRGDYDLPDELLNLEVSSVDQAFRWMRQRDITPDAIVWQDHDSPRLNLSPSRYTDKERRSKNTFSLSMLGAYVAPRSHVLQLWCDDSATRRTRDQLTVFLERVSSQLELPSPLTEETLQRHARKVGYGPINLKG
ncbi:hypothetical protein [Spirillospora sp. NPDC029432]|uniref:hypothetical protein n=1 Tax=Spirillospora sp. NPDC029432 TaxID=3154599 RepID=UPI0034559EB3